MVVLPWSLKPVPPANAIFSPAAAGVALFDPAPGGEEVAAVDQRRGHGAVADVGAGARMPGLVEMRTRRVRPRDRASARRRCAARRA